MCRQYANSVTTKGSMAWCNLKGRTEGVRIRIKCKFKFKNSQKQNGLLVFTSLRRKRRVRGNEDTDKAAVLHVTRTVMLTHHVKKTLL